MTPAKNHTCLELVFDFPDGCTYWDMDLDHIKTKVLTHRSNHSCEIGVDASCYYEAAKTLLNILDLFYITGRLANPFRQIRLAISPDKTDGIPYVKLVAISNMKSPTHYTALERVAYITMVYSNADTIKNADGIFMIKLGMMTPTSKFNVEQVLGGTDVFTAEYVTPQSAAWEFLDPHSADECWVAGPVLKYSENFPSPSIMIGKIDKMFANLENEYSKWEANAIQPSGGNTCVAGWTKVMTDFGDVEIRRLVGDVVRVWNGQIYSVVKVSEFNDDNPSLIVTFSNHKQLFVTKNHEFIMSDGSIKPAGELQVNDCLAAWTKPDGTADVATVVEIQDGPVLGKVYHVQDPLQHRAMYDGIITVN